jgi:DNA repair photolyase
MPISLFQHDMKPGLELARRVDPKYAPVWQNKPAAQQAALARYFLPHRSAKDVLGVTRPRVVKWYCPFADQRHFPTGHRYCINVYTGCSHGCVYCYAAGYLAMDAKPKTDYRRQLLRDLADLDAFDVPPAPAHLANSTDAFQAGMEETHGHALFTLQQLARHRNRFTTITLLTKNPGLLAREAYLDILRGLHHPDGPVVIEVSLAFWRERIARTYDPGAPSIRDRRAAIGKLRQAGLPVVIRISPTYPIDLDPPGQACPQTASDMEELAAFAADVGAVKLVHTPAKIVRPKFGRLHPLMASMLELYRHLSRPGQPDFKGGSWRLPRPVAERCVVQPLREICARHEVPLEFCMAHLLATR